MVTRQLTLSQAIANFILYKETIGRSEHTIARPPIAIERLS
jgi:hypothetical protein